MCLSVRMSCHQEILSGNNLPVTERQTTNMLDVSFSVVSGMGNCIAVNRWPITHCCVSRLWLLPKQSFEYYFKNKKANRNLIVLFLVYDALLGLIFKRPDITMPGRNRQVSKEQSRGRVFHGKSKVLHENVIALVDVCSAWTRCWVFVSSVSPRSVVFA